MSASFRAAYFARRLFLALVRLPQPAPRTSMAVGLAHSAYTFESLDPKTRASIRSGFRGGSRCASSASLAVDSHGGLTKVARDRAQPDFPTGNHETPDYPVRSRSRSCTHELVGGWEAHCNSRCRPRPRVRST